MKLHVKRDFKKLFFFCDKKRKKYGDMLCINPKCKCAAGALAPYFKINAPSFCCHLFLKQYLNPRVRIDKLINRHSANYYPSPSGVTSRIHPLIHLQNLWRWIPFQKFSYIFSRQTPVSHHGCANFSHLQCLDYWKIYLRAKKLNLDIPSKQNFLPGYHLP